MTYVVNTIELRKAMAEAKITTISQLASIAGIDRNTASGIVNGKIRPSSVVNEKIAIALHLDGNSIGRIFFHIELT